MTKEKTIKPCPFCGSCDVRMYSEQDENTHGFIHICNYEDDGMVKVESRLFSSDDEAIAVWNRRAK